MDIITLGIGTPGGIVPFLLFGLSPAGLVDIRAWLAASDALVTTLTVSDALVTTLTVGDEGDV